MVILEHPASIVGRMLYSLHLNLQSPPILAATVARGEELSPGATGHATGCLRHLEVRYFPDWVTTFGRTSMDPAINEPRATSGNIGEILSPS